MAMTPVEQVWESFEKVRENWESETKAAASQRARGGDTGEEDERRMEQKKGGRRETGMGEREGDES